MKIRNYIPNGTSILFLIPMVLLHTQTEPCTVYKYLEVVLQKDQSVSLRKVFFFFTPDYSVSFVILLKATISQIPELRELCCQLSTHQRNEQDPALTGPQV